MEAFSLPHFGQWSVAVLVLSAGSIIIWLAVAISAWRHGGHLFLILVFATVFCLLSEYFAIRLGKYHYALFPLSLPEWVGIPGTDRLLAWLSGRGPFPEIMQVEGVQKAIPVEVALIEGSLLYAVFRITDFLSPLQPAGPWSFANALPWLAARWPNPVLNGFLAVSLDSMLDPVVAGTQSIDGSGPTVEGLALWTWHTNAQYAGHWFGVPLANYNAWFAALFAFTIATRVKRRELKIFKFALGPRGLNVWVCLKAIGLLVFLLFLIKFSLDYLTYEAFGLFGSPTPPAWQFAIGAAMIAAGVIAAATVARRAVRDAPFEPVTVAPIVFVCASCAAALILAGPGVYPERSWLMALWMPTTTIAFVHAQAPWRLRTRPAATPTPAA